METLLNLIGLVFIFVIFMFLVFAFHKMHLNAQKRQYWEIEYERNNERNNELNNECEDEEDDEKEDEEEDTTTQVDIIYSDKRRLDDNMFIKINDIKILPDIDSLTVLVDGVQKQIYMNANGVFYVNTDKYGVIFFQKESVVVEEDSEDTEDTEEGDGEGDAGGDGTDGEGEGGAGGGGGGDTGDT